MPPSWLEIEADFASSLLDADASKPLPLRETRPGRGARGIAIHRNNFRVSLADALKDNFPVTALLVGDEFFAGMAGIFISRCPPTSAVLAEYGAALPEFIDDFTPAGGIPYLADIARLEAAWMAAYHAADAAALSPADLQVIPVDVLAASVVTLHPATRLVHSRYPIASIWHSQRTGSRDEILWCEEAALIVRPEAEVRVTSLEPAAGLYLSLLLSGQTLEQAAAECGALNPSLDPGRSFIDLVLAGAVKSLELPTDDSRSPE